MQQAKDKPAIPRTPPTLAGGLVTLRALDPPRDAGDYYQLCLEPDMHRWTGNDVLPSVEQARRELKRFAATPGILMWAIVDNATGRMMGRFFIRPEDRDGRRVIGEGNRVAKPFWRKGHNREARRLIFHYVFDVLRADRVETECWDENVNSRLSILAHGFEVVRRVWQFNPRHGRTMDKVLFVLTRERWQRMGADACPGSRRPCPTP